MTKTKTKFNVRTMAFIALCTAITCILGPLSIPLPFSPVPISLTILAVFISVYALGIRWGMVSLSLYILIGVVGVPVFSKFQGGPGVLIGPTGGYIIGYVFVVLFSGIFILKFENKRYMHVIGMVIGVALCYLFGTFWLAYQASMTFTEALFTGVIPFIPADAVKIIIAIIVGPQIRKALKKLQG